jgi:hypothetical protein
MNAGEQLEHKLNGIADGRSLHTTMIRSNGSWSVDIQVLDPECPSQSAYAASGEHEKLETAIILAAQALAEKEKQYDAQQQHLSRPVHLPSGFAWAYQLVVKPVHNGA